MSTPNDQNKLIVANCSGFFGDRFTAAKEMVEGGRIDVLTGDYLAELTMAILLKDTFKDPNRGYARTFLKPGETDPGCCKRRRTEPKGAGRQALRDRGQSWPSALHRLHHRR
jgi:hypothetical protein